MSGAPTILRLAGVCLASWVMIVPAAFSSSLNLPRDGWVTWQIPAVAGAPGWCCHADLRDDGDAGRQACRLDENNYGYGSRDREETTDEGRIYARFAGGKLERLRALAASCPVTAISPIHELAGVTVEDSAAWLISVVAQVSADSSGSRRLTGDAMAVLAMHRSNRARDALAVVARTDTSVKNRKDALFWLTQVRGNEGAEIAAPIMFDDRDPKVREHAAFAISQTKWPQTTPNLIRLGKGDPDRRVRGQAWFWLAQTQSSETEKAIFTALQSDPEASVREQSIFALSQLPENRAARALMGVAEDKSLPREERKRAIFWLGQMKSASAVEYLDKLLTSNVRN